MIEKYKTRDEWLAARSNGIGGSDAATVLGENPYKSKFELWAEKTGNAPEKDLSDVSAIKWGTRLESVIADAYAEESKRKVSDPGAFTIYRNNEHKFQAATLDRVQVFDHDSSLHGLVQIKAVGLRQSERWNGNPPIQYQIQVQHELAASGLDWATLVVLVGGQQMKWYDVERDDDFIDLMTKAEAEFWGWVKNDIEPPVDNSDSCSQALRRMYPKDNGKEVALPTDVAEWWDEYKRAGDDVKELEATKSLMKNRIINAIGEASFGVLPDGQRWSYKHQKRAGHTVAASEFRVLRKVKSKS